MIEINYLVGCGISKTVLKEIAGKVLRGEKNGMELSVVTVGEKRIGTLNRKYRKKNKPTDILSFNYGEAGEIVICPEQVRKNAKEYKSTFKQELIKVLIHGVLHLLGYDHEKSSQKAEIMRRRENFYLNKILNIKS